MRPLLVIRQVILRARLAPIRTFTYESSRLSNPRPQVPFLGIPTAPQQHRFLTTQRRQWLRYEVFLFFKYSVYIWIAATSVAAIAFAVNEEWLERDSPTPPEWSFLTRWRLRGAKYERDRKDVGEPRYVQMMEIYLKALERLEDPKKDGGDVRPLWESPDDEKNMPVDISAKSEEWRRGYFETLLALCQISEHIEGWMVDRKTRYVFPPEMVVGPSNPRPKPIPPGIKTHPLLENCEVAYADPTTLYGKLLGTEGLSTAQRIEAQLSYANWLEYKFRDAAQLGLPNPAELMLGDAIAEALQQTEFTKQQAEKGLPLEDRKAILQAAVSRLDGVPSENLLKCLTAYATYKARSGEVAVALPIFVSVLRARRAMPKAIAKTSLVGQGKSGKPSVNILEQVSSSIYGWITPPQYPPPPPDGSAPPIRDAEEICKEAGLMLHIGEIMYAAKDSSREEGLAWTRDAVDIAEEQLHKARQQPDSAAAKSTCRTCLSSGLENWATMVSRLAREEGAQKTPPATSKTSWFGLWGDGRGQEHEQGRWAAEEKVIQERARRVSELLEDLEPPKKGLASIIHA